MATIFSVLDAIRHRSGMFLRETESFWDLHVFLIGYCAATHVHGVQDDEVEGDFLDDFGAYLCDRFGWPAEFVGIGGVAKHHADKTTLWAHLFSLFDDFRADLARKRSQQPG